MEPQFTRADERRLDELRRRIAGGSDLDDAEMAELNRLIEAHKAFLDEGERRLREGVAASEAPAPGPSWLSSIAGTLSTAAAATYYWSSFVCATGVPGTVGRSLGVAGDFSHWNVIADGIVLGAVPVLTEALGHGNHLAKLGAQLRTADKQLGMVVACLTEAELDGFGVHMLAFAKRADWEAAFSPAPEYVLLPYIDGSATQGESTGEPPSKHHRDVQDVVQRMDRLASANKAVYVHCKAGKGRSWMIVMCYLTTALGLTYEEAEARVRSKRHQVNPSAAQQQFVRDHIAWSAAQSSGRS